jgi:hypothetical protein
LPMWLHQGFKGDIGFIEQSIHSFYIFPGLRLEGSEAALSSAM